MRTLLYATADIFIDSLFAFIFYHVDNSATKQPSKMGLAPILGRICFSTKTA